LGFTKLVGKHHAVAYWGRYRGLGVHSTLVGDQTIFRALGLHVDKVLGVGIQAELWREVYPSPFAESAPISGVQVISFAAGIPAGPGTLLLTLAGAARNMTWTAPGGAASVIVDVRNGGTFTLVSSGNAITFAVNKPFLPQTGGPYIDTVTFTRSHQRVPTFDPQVDQTTVTNKAFPICSCYKQTSKQPDNKCRSCWGSGTIPGYTKFGYTEFTFAATDPANTLVNTSLFTEYTPYRLQISPGFLTGTVTSPIYTVTPAVVASVNPFQFQVDSYLRQPAGTSVLVEFSINAGLFSPIAGLSTLSIAAGSTIQFRVTLTRALLTDKSPFFEIMRSRFARLDEPWIRVLKAMPARPRSREQYGVSESDGPVRWWTVPLMFFDDQLPQDPDTTAPHQGNMIQAKAFLEFKEGAYVGRRYSVVSVSHSDPKGIFISQNMVCRLLLPDEIESQVP
jgi:hypothetical protein